MNRLPWRYSLSRGANQNSFLDPASLLATPHSPAQPPEADGPGEFLRANSVSLAPGNQAH